MMSGVIRERTIPRIEWNAFQIAGTFEELPQGFKDLLYKWEAHRPGLTWDELSTERKREILSLLHI